MEISGWTIYWLTRLDSIQDALCTIAVIFGVCGLFGSIVMFCELGKKWGIILWAIIIPWLVAGAALTPSTKDMAAIIVIPKMANSETVHEIGGEMVRLAREWLDELRPVNPEDQREGRE